MPRAPHADSKRFNQHHIHFLVVPCSIALPLYPKFLQRTRTGSKMLCVSNLAIGQSRFFPSFIIVHWRTWRSSWCRSSRLLSSNELSEAFPLTMQMTEACRKIRRRRPIARGHFVKRSHFSCVVVRFHHRFTEYLPAFPNVLGSGDAWPSRLLYLKKNSCKNTVRLPTSVDPEY